MTSLLFKNATLINEGRCFTSDLLVKDKRIALISDNIPVTDDMKIINADGKYLIPGMIDDQVHFRDPGLTHKGDITTESKAAIAGGITSYMEMPNVNPQTTTIEALEEKYARAANKSYANYAFYLGATNDNLEEIKKLKPNQACGVKIFMGASTGNMLVDDEETLSNIFEQSPVLIATHCEHTPTINTLEKQYLEAYGEDIPMQEHPNIRSAEACLISSQFAVELAKKYGTRLHVLHLTTAEELNQFDSALTLEQLAKKQITAEVCVHHLYFNSNDYEHLGSQIKCNPAIKNAHHQAALIQAVKDGIIDIIATDHAPHTKEEKQQSYFKAPSGLPLVQHALQSALEFYHQGVFDLPLIVQKTSHAPAVRFQIKERGFLREGYFADLVLVDLHQEHEVKKENLFYKCAWSPFEGVKFSSSILMTLVNGKIAFEHGKHNETRSAMRLDFDR